MDKKYLEKTKSFLQDLINCLNTKERNEFLSIISNIKSLMFNVTNELLPDFTLILSNNLSGYFSTMIWNIILSGAYYGDKINGYKVEDIIKCTQEIIKALDIEINKLEEKEIKSFNDDFLKACSKLQSRIIYHDKKEQSGKVSKTLENKRTDYLKDILEAKGYKATSQEREGISSTGKDAGEVDLLITDSELQYKIYIECMNLNCLNKNYIETHYEKIFLYDLSLNKNNYLVSYVTVSDFEEFCNKYQDYFEEYDGKTKCSTTVECDTNFANIKMFITKSIHNGVSIKTNHILINLELI